MVFYTVVDVDTRSSGILAEAHSARTGKSRISSYQCIGSLNGCYLNTLVIISFIREHHSLLQAIVQLLFSHYFVYIGSVVLTGSYLFVFFWFFNTLHPPYNALQYNADSVITRSRSWTPIFQVAGRTQALPAQQRSGGDAQHHSGDDSTPATCPAQHALRRSEWWGWRPRVGVSIDVRGMKHNAVQTMRSSARRYASCLGHQ